MIIEWGGSPVGENSNIGDFQVQEEFLRGAVEVKQRFKSGKPQDPDPLRILLDPSVLF